MNAARVSFPRLNFRTLRESEISSMNLHDVGTIFCSAAGLVGGHGAGLTNMMWMTPRNVSFVAQIVRSANTGRLYKIMADAFQLRHIEINTNVSVGHYADTVVDSASLAAHLQPWLEKLSSSYSSQTID